MSHSSSEHQQQQHQQQNSDHQSSTRNTRIFIGGLESGITVEQIESEFSRFGRIQQTPWLGKSGTFGFVVFEEEQAAEEAVKAMNGQTVFSETALRVELAQPKPQGYRRPRYDNPHFDSIYRRGGRSYGSAPYSRSSYGNYNRGGSRGGDHYSSHHHHSSRDNHYQDGGYGNSHGGDGGGRSRNYESSSHREGGSSGDRRERREDSHRYPPREYRSSHYESSRPRDYRN